MAEDDKTEPDDGQTTNDGQQRLHFLKINLLIEKRIIIILYI